MAGARRSFCAGAGSERCESDWGQTWGQTEGQTKSGTLESLRLEDLALACACAEGNAAAWDHFVLEYRPVLYRSADAMDSSGGARELADSLYADLFGLPAEGDERRSLFRYFHGRSSLATWLRAVLAQRQVDRARAAAKTAPLPDEDICRARRARVPTPTAVAI